MRMAVNVGPAVQMDLSIMQQGPAIRLGLSSYLKQAGSIRVTCERLPNV